MTLKTTAPATTELDTAIVAAERDAVVLWRGEPIPFADVPERVARATNRHARDLLFGSYVEAVEMLNARYEERLARWRAAGQPDAGGFDPSELAVTLEPFALHAETPYFAALRRYLALVDIEQGDATLADLWHVMRGSAWNQWFGPRTVARAVAGAGRPGEDDAEGWVAAERMLAGDPADAEDPVRGAVGEAYATIVAAPEWLADEVGMAEEERIPFTDFATFVRLERLRQAQGELLYELRLHATDDRDINRAYYSGIVGHMIGAHVPEGLYLAAIPAPFASARRLRRAILAAQAVEVLERRHGTAWWRDPASAELLAEVSSASGEDDALARLGYDGLDWRPLLRQIRTRLIGEMSGYGGPNITTRAGTRKV
jgi:hypothetical protein